MSGLNLGEWENKGSPLYVLQFILMSALKSPLTWGWPHIHCKPMQVGPSSADANGFI